MNHFKNKSLPLLTAQAVAACVLILTVCPATAARIYNGAPKLEHPDLLPHRVVKMDELWATENKDTDFGVIDEAHVRGFVADLPADRGYEFDLEGNPARPDLNLHLWYYDERPENAVALRQQIMSIIDDARPDLDIGIWSIPHDVHIVQREYKNKAKALAMVHREIEFQKVTKYSDTIYISAYWRHYSLGTAANFEQWKKEVRLKVILAETFHGQKPQVYVWHRGYRLRRGLLDPAVFDAMLKFLDEEGLGIVFWAGQRDAEFPDWVVDSLAKYSY